jgi:hypothetical protein
MQTINNFKMRIFTVRKPFKNNKNTWVTVFYFLLSLSSLVYHAYHKNATLDKLFNVMSMPMHMASVETENGGYFTFTGS